MWDAQSDPLGTALQTRGRDSRLSYMNGPGFGHMSGVLPSNQWDGYFQALNEGGVDKVAQGSPFGAQGAPASGLRQAMPGYSAPDNRNQIALGGLNAAFKPNFGRPSGPNYNG